MLVYLLMLECRIGLCITKIAYDCLLRKLSIPCVISAKCSHWLLKTSAGVFCCSDA